MTTSFDYTQPQTLSIREAAVVLGLPESTAYKLAREDRFPVRVLHIGRTYRVPIADLERYVTGAA